MRNYPTTRTQYYYELKNAEDEIHNLKGVLLTGSVAKTYNEMRMDEFVLNYLSSG